MEDRILLVFSVAFSLWACGAMLIPYIRRRHDLLTARNFFLMGALFYVGFSGVKASLEGHFHPYTQKTFLIYYGYTILFFVVFSLAYRKAKWPARAADRHFQKLPLPEGLGLWFPLMLACVAMLGQLVMVQAPGLRVLVSRAGMIAPVFALAFALAIWRRAKFNPIAILVVSGVFLMGAYLAFSVGGGRRPLYGLVLTAPCCIYWWYFRYQRPVKVLSIFAALLVIAPIGDSAYRAARWYGHTGATKNQEVGAGTRWEIFKQSLFARDESFGQSALQIGQTTTENSLLTAYIFHEGSGSFPQFRVKPLHSLYVIATLPIPRKVWEDKPVTLAISLPYDSGILTKEMARTNWGPGIVAHIIHDGGIPVALLYAVLIGVALRYFDELLVRHPGNPFFMGFLCAASVQIAGLVRGDLSAMAPLALLSFVIMIGLLWATRMVVGVDASWDPAGQLAGTRDWRRLGLGPELRPREGSAP